MRCFCLRKLDQVVQHPPGRAAIETSLGQPDAFRQGLGLAPNHKGGGGIQNHYVSAGAIKLTRKNPLSYRGVLVRIPTPKIFRAGTGEAQIDRIKATRFHLSIA